MEFIDLKAQYKELKTEIDKGIETVLAHGKFIMGPEVRELENALEEFVDRKYCITCANGTDALQIAYMALNIKKGDAIFCPSVTFIASIEPAYMMGATPVFCDIDIKTFNICVESLELQIKKVISEGKLTPKVVVAVDFIGNPADYDQLIKICELYNLVLIEDAAQSMGASYQSKKCCSFGKLATTSFFPSKPLGAYGDGGAVFTDDEELYELCNSYRLHGKGNNKYDNVRIGLNSRLDTLQAAILMPKLHSLQKQEINMRQKIARKYNEALKGKYQIELIKDGNVSAYAQYAVLAKDFEEREKIMQSLNENGIPNMIYYPTPMHKLKVFEGLECDDSLLRNANKYCETTFSLPMHPYLTDIEQEQIIEVLLR